MISLHLLKLMVNNNMKWITFWIQGFLNLIFYLLAWYDVDKRTWEPIKNLLNTIKKVHKFHQ
jgi:uncharacterized membrane-anchored protein YitT (DUF2179 family)